mmetsp:Transcript_9627/g.28547  ORF Transcript_9627/g.28547 Transcript_9627/m.28547 type:complete len:253 (+) Transcript_9627:1359-2117(+)
MERLAERRDRRLCVRDDTARVEDAGVAVSLEKALCMARAPAAAAVEDEGGVAIGREGAEGHAAGVHVPHGRERMRHPGEGTVNQLGRSERANVYDGRARARHGGRNLVDRADTIGRRTQAEARAAEGAPDGCGHSYAARDAQHHEPEPGREGCRAQADEVWAGAHAAEAPADAKQGCAGDQLQVDGARCGRAVEGRCLSHAQAAGEAVEAECDCECGDEEDPESAIEARRGQRAQHGRRAHHACEKREGTLS